MSGCLAAKTPATPVATTLLRGPITPGAQTNSRAEGTPSRTEKKSKCAKMTELELLEGKLKRL